jgi:hypothetical protein
MSALWIGVDEQAPCRVEALRLQAPRQDATHVSLASLRDPPKFPAGERLREAREENLRKTPGNPKQSCRDRVLA